MVITGDGASEKLDKVMEIAARVAGLEKREKWWTAARVSGLVLLSWLALIGVAHTFSSIGRRIWPSRTDYFIAKTVEAEQIQIKRPGSKVKCIIGFDGPGRDVIASFERDEGQVMSIGASENGDGYIVFYDERHREILYLSLGHPPRAGGPSPAAETDALAPSIGFVGSSDEVALELGLAPRRRPFVRMTSSKGDVFSVLTPTGKPSILTFFDPPGTPAIRMGVVDRVPRLIIQDTDAGVHEFPPRQKK